MWSQYELADAGWELVRALHTDNPDLVYLASAILDSTCRSRPAAS